ncbi:cytochrome d ubiquinol oxidase subunit II [Cryptosporangium phraense]|uniref:Cytochrome d ubiquinol oxidase subunit II n=1 Tax=Cryptosporangium phraense TaxID=2593070 RepID=A0A545ALD0_9ACTN|nr:cytochrome d ubiquinol oxidase subunit II [Cryptosporangium phraense]TQS42117.1 cytochrome d ubiquinol oxidase subunit II [Cryptosporangium phraense]
MSTFAAVVLFVGVVAYAVFGGADYGAGFWDLTAGGAVRGREPRHLVDTTLAPVWEANHVWLIFCLVMLWTGFPATFAAITTTLYVPLGLAALGIVVRGSGFAFRKVVVHTEQQRVTGAAFATSSVITPFFLGTVAGGVASGRVPADGHGDAITSWLNPTSLLGGVLAVLVCAFVAAVFLTAEARRRPVPAAELERRKIADLGTWFRRRAQVSAVATGVVALAGIAILRADSPRLFDGLLSRGLPFVVVSGLCGVGALVLLGRAAPRVLQGLAVTAAGTIVAGWGVAQYPYLLGTHVTIAEGAAPSSTLWALTIIATIALLIVVPSLSLLFVLQQRGRLQH